MELHPWAILAKGPPCTNAGVPSVVWTRLGCMASLSRTVIAPATPRSFTVNGSFAAPVKQVIITLLILPAEYYAVLKSAERVFRDKSAVKSYAGEFMRRQCLYLFRPAFGFKQFFVLFGDCHYRLEIGVGNKPRLCAFWLFHLKKKRMDR